MSKSSRGIHTLSAVGVARLNKAGYHADGGGLYLQISPAGTKSWIFRFKLSGRAREMGLGPLRSLGLADARAKAAVCRQQLLNGVDPIEARKLVRAEGRLEAAKATTFDACAKAYIAAHKASWKNAKHISQWENTLDEYTGKVFGNLPVQEVDTALVMRVLEPMWSEKPETASRLRGRIEAVLDWATVRGLRRGENPARWRGHLKSLLPARSKVRAVKHHPALPWNEVPQFIRALRARDGTAARALEFLILTAVRSGEVRGAVRGEFDLKAKVWTIPAARMKMKVEHAVPLSQRAVQIVEQQLATSDKTHVFPGRKDAPLSDMSVSAVIRRMNEGEKVVWRDPKQDAAIVPHGFRSTFRDWVATRTSYPHEVAEAALAHAIENKVVAAYRRSDLFEKRRRLMVEWGKYCESVGSGSNVTPIRSATG